MSSAIRLPSLPPVPRSLEVSHKRRVAWQLPLYRQDTAPGRYTAEELADMYAVRHDVDVQDVAVSHAAFAETCPDLIAFCDACGKEVPATLGALDNCPHCGW